MSWLPVRRALISVSDKDGLADFARGLAEWGVEIISTGGTARMLREVVSNVRDVSDVTQFPEMLDGRVKTLHPRIHAGILAIRDNPEHMKALADHGIEAIDMVVCNLYPFEDVAARPGAGHQEIVENIDIGGPSMVRAAAKNYAHVAVVTSPDQYPSILEELRSGHGALSLETREKLAAAAFARTAIYDAAIQAYFQSRVGGDALPDPLILTYEMTTPLRYGENPHQRAAFYVKRGLRLPALANAEQLHGKELSYNNLLDLDSAYRLVAEFDTPAAVVIKHNNPCGAATATNLKEAFIKAYEGDPISAFGSILGFNRELDEETAYAITEPNRFIECIIAPGYSAAAVRLLTTRPTWKKSVRLLKTAASAGSADAFDFRRIDGGLLLQSVDLPADDFSNAETKTTRHPTAEEMADLQFAWRVCKHVKSNAIVLAKQGQVVGVGAGQMSRVDAVFLAIRKAGDRAKGSVLASDAFFPFRDNVDLAAEAGVTAIVQPGGSKRDQESIDACNERGLAMLFTGIRHFRH